MYINCDHMVSVTLFKQKHTNKWNFVLNSAQIANDVV